MIKFVSDLQQVGGFLSHDKTEILLKVASNTHYPTLGCAWFCAVVDTKYLGSLKVDILLYSEICQNQTTLGTNYWVQNRQVFGL